MQLAILGASGHGKVVADIAAHCGYSKIVFLDDDETVLSCMGYPVVGTIRDTGSYADYDFFVAIGNAATRERIQREVLHQGLRIATLVHPSAVIASHVALGVGTVVMAGAVVNPGATIGDGCIINTCASVDHDSILEDYVHVSVGSHLAGTVHIGKGTWIGAGATVSNNIYICADCMIGAGAVVVRNIEEASTYVGVPAKRLEEV